MNDEPSDSIPLAVEICQIVLSSCPNTRFIRALNEGPQEAI